MSRVLIPLLLLCLLLTQAPAWSQPIDNDPLVSSDHAAELIRRGEFEKGLEQLRRAYLMFPLDPTLKHNLAEGYAAYGHQLFKQKKFEQADENFLKAMELYPEEATYALLRGICNYNLKKYDIARYELERANRTRPDTVEILYYLGLVLYDSDDRQRGVELWEQALKLSPGRREVEELLKKARREMAVEQGMDRGHSSRFDLTYDPGVSTTFALAVLDVLEQAANQVGAELGVFPSARVPVAIYQRGDFNTVTESPDWSAGVYDGTIRLPFGTLQEVSPTMRGVLYHEYAHVVVFELTRGNCPLWLNEGIAEMFGRSQHNQALGELGKAMRSGSETDFRKLETGFSGLATPQATLAYQQSYSLVNFMVSSYGWHRVTETLRQLGSGATIDQALSAAYGDYSLNYDGLVQEWKRSVGR